MRSTTNVPLGDDGAGVRATAIRVATELQRAIPHLRREMDACVDRLVAMAETDPALVNGFVGLQAAIHAVECLCYVVRTLPQTTAKPTGQPFRWDQFACASCGIRTLPGIEKCPRCGGARS